MLESVVRSMLEDPASGLDERDIAELARARDVPAVKALLRVLDYAAARVQRQIDDEPALDDRDLRRDFRTLVGTRRGLRVAGAVLDEARQLHLEKREMTR